MVDPITAITAKTISQPVIDTALKEFGKALKPSLGGLAVSIRDRTIVALQLGFTDYLTTSYNRCRYFKTILTGGQPIELISHYVNVTLTCGSVTVEDDALVDSISKYKRIIITGLAGSGKSMFMRYISIRHFEQPRGLIPLFIELRLINEITEKNLITFIRTYSTSILHDVSEQQFLLSLSSGNMLLIFDGFDELKHEFRDQIQASFENRVGSVA